MRQPAVKGTEQMKTLPIAIAFFASTLAAGCQSQGASLKAQYRERIVGQCNMQAQMAAQSGLPNLQPLCDCMARQIDSIPDDQFAQPTNPMQVSQMEQQMQAQCMQSIGGMGGMGGGMQPGMGPGMSPGMGPGMQPGMGPGIYGGALNNGNEAVEAGNLAK